jgi:hypothetical protein
MGDKPKRYRLKLSRLDFVSLVDDPAQPNAKTLLIKGRGAAVEGETHAKFVKASDELGLAFFWAFTSTNPDGSDHYDLHGDTIEQDFVKAAMEFMLDGGGAVDEMHDGKSSDARVAFAMPMTPEIAKAFSIDAKQSGLMVALKVTDDQLAKLKSGEYTGVSIAGLGEREPVTARKSSDKRYFTDEILGHQHEVCVYDDGFPWMTDATVEGGTAPHRHTVTRDTEGKLAVLADSGHTHTLTEMPKVIVAPADAVVVTEEKRGSAPTVVNVTFDPRTLLDAASSTTTTAIRNAIASKSTRLNLTRKVAPMTLEEALAEIEDLKAKLEAAKGDTSDAEKRASLTDAQRAHLKGLDKADAATFLAKSTSERDAAIAKALESDPVEVEFNGQSYRKSAGSAVVELAKAAKAQAEMLAKQADEIEKSDIRKAAADLFGGMPGDNDTHDYITRVLRKDAAMYEKAAATIRGMKSTSSIGKKAPGAGGEAVAEGNEAELASLVAKHVAEHKTDERTARLAVVKSGRGRELYNAIEIAKKSR